VVVAAAAGSDVQLRKRHSSALFPKSREEQLAQQQQERNAPKPPSIEAKPITLLETLDADGNTVYARCVSGNPWCLPHRRYIRPSA
jgi:hypothetical protein